MGFASRLSQAKLHSGKLLVCTSYLVLRRWHAARVLPRAGRAPEAGSGQCGVELAKGWSVGRGLTAMGGHQRGTVNHASSPESRFSVGWFVTARVGRWRQPPHTLASCRRKAAIAAFEAVGSAQHVMTPRPVL